MHLLYDLPRFTRYTIKAKYAKDITQLNPEESEYVLLPNAKLRVVSVRKQTNLPFADFAPGKVAAWLESFEPPLNLVAKHVVEKKVTGEQVRSSFTICKAFPCLIPLTFPYISHFDF